MKNIKIFPKTFVLSFIVFSILIGIAHIAIYTFMPKVYMDEKEKTFKKNVETYESKSQKIPKEEIFNFTKEFAQDKNMNISISKRGRQEFYKSFHNFSLDLDKNKKFQSDDENILVDLKKFNVDTSNILMKQEKILGHDIIFMYDVKSVEDARKITLKIMPYTFLACLFIALIFSYLYSRTIVKPVNRLMAVSERMKELEEDAYFDSNGGDEIHQLGGHINDLYESLWNTIYSLERENDYIASIEKERVDFFRTANHELKTPLASLNLILENMLYDVGDYRNHKKYINKCLLLIEESTDIIENILRESQKLYQEDIAFSLKEVVCNVVSQYELLIKEKGYDFEMDVEDISIHSNPSLFERVLSNLISNSIRHSRKNGRIEIYTKDASLWIYNQCEPMSYEDIKEAFRPLKSSSSSGLYLVKSMLDGKNISYEFRPEKEGMVFRISI